MDDPFDRGRWPLPRLAVELDDLAARSHPPQGDVDREGADWAVDHLLDGATPRELCEAALWVGLRRGRAEGRGTDGLVTHAVLAAPSCAAIGADDHPTAAMAAVQLIAYTLGAYRGGVNDHREGPRVLGWYEPSPAEEHPVEAFLDACAQGECELADHRWLDAAHASPDEAEAALVSAGAAGYHLNEHKLILPAQLRAWIGPDAAAEPVLFRAAARYAGNHLQDPAHAESRRADAAALAMAAEERGDHGRTGGDLERVSVVATGIARTPARELAPLVTGSLADGLFPIDLVHALSLVAAARFALTPSTSPGPIGTIHAGTGANAVRRCLQRATTPELRYELALCATESPQMGSLVRLEELSAPPFDDGGLEDLLAALEDGDPDAAAEAASAIPPHDEAAIATAWRAIERAAATDQWMLLHAVKHAVAMREDFNASSHPARIWYLAAAARSAAHASANDQPLTDAFAARLG